MIIRLIFSAFLSLVFTGCFDERVQITSQYIINPSWDGKTNSIKINRMVLKKDSTINYLSKPDQIEILNKLKEDSAFRWFADARIPGIKNYKNAKVFFNRDNGFNWLNDVTGQRVKVLGQLEKGNWYKFSHLVSNPYYVYIYIDSANIEHQFDVDLSNY